MGFSVWASVVVACRLQSMSSAVVVHRFSCSVACGVFPYQGLNPYPLHWPSDSYSLYYRGGPALVLLILASDIVSFDL